MRNQPNESGLPMLPGQFEPVRVGRRLFLRYASAAAAGGAILASCKGEDNPTTIAPITSVDLGKDDIGILNYAYALEQLEAAFYTQVITMPYANMPDAEKTLLTDIRNHEIIHREFSKPHLEPMPLPV